MEFYERMVLNMNSSYSIVMDIVNIGDFVNISDYIFGAAGSGLAIYSYYKQRQSEDRNKLLERRLRRKENHHELSKDLYTLYNGMTDICNSLRDPTTHEDLRFSLRRLGRDVLAYHHTTGEPATVYTHEISISGENTKLANGSRDVLSAYKNSQIVHANVSIENNSQIFDDDLVYYIDDAFLHMGIIYGHIEKIKSTYTDFSERYELMDSITKIFDDIIIAIYDQIFQMMDGRSFDPSEYKSTSSLTEDIYVSFINSNE